MQSSLSLKVFDPRSRLQQDGDEDQVGADDGRVELGDPLLQKQLFRRLQTGAVTAKEVVLKLTLLLFVCLFVDYL